MCLCIDLWKAKGVPADLVMVVRAPRYFVWEKAMGAGRIGRKTMFLDQKRKDLIK